MTQPETPTSICWKCGHSYEGYSGLRHFGTFTAHQESDCIELLRADIAAAIEAKERAEERIGELNRHFEADGVEHERLEARVKVLESWLKEAVNELDYQTDGELPRLPEMRAALAGSQSDREEG